MKKTTLIKTMLLLCALVVGSGSVWAVDVTATLTGSNLLEGNSPSTSYAEHTTGITDDKGFTYTGRWTYQKNGKVYLNMIQMKAVESSNSTRILLPTFDGTIKSITITATNTSATESTGTGVTTQLAIVKGTTYTSAFATNAANQVLKIAPSSATNTYSFDFTTLDKSYDGTDLYICAASGSGIRIWSIVVVYSEVDYYNVIYNYNDGVTANKVVQVAKASAASYTLDSDPSRTDFSFEGWNDGTNTYDGGAAYALTKGVTFTAQWSFTGTPTVYNRSNKNDIATGAQYIMAGVKDDVWGYASGISGSNTYIDSKSFEIYSTISASSASLTCESPLVITLEETADGWYLKDSGGHKLGLSGDKKVKWDDGDMAWSLGGTSDVPTFTATYSSSDYILKYNGGAVRFTGYTSGQQDVYFYRLNNGKKVYTLTLDYNYGEVADATHRVLEGATYTLPIPTREGYHFVGWNTSEDGSGTNNPAGSYTMPAAATTLYAKWSTTAPITITSAGFATLYTAEPLNFATLSSELKAYTASVEGSTVTLTQVNDIPANTGVVLKGSAKTHNIPVIASSSTAKGDLTGSTTEATAYNAFSGYDLYMLALNGKNEAQFTLANAGEIAAGKAFLKLTHSEARNLSVVFGDDETTAIRGIENGEMKVKNSFFDLQGRRVAQPTKGLYIVNGKKVVIK